MDAGIVPGNNDERKLFQHFMGQYGGPAFVRRARQVQAAYDDLIECCRRQREAWLTYVRLSLGTMFALAGSTAELLTLFDQKECLATLETLYGALKPALRLPVAPTKSKRILQRTLAELREAIELFNGRWLRFVQAVDLRPLNELREGYNRFYIMEKECALGSARVARQGFRKLEPMETEQLLTVFPLLAMP